MKRLKIQKDTKKAKFNKPTRLKMPLKTNLKAGSGDWLWAWPEPKEENKD